MLTVRKRANEERACDKRTRARIDEKMMNKQEKTAPAPWISTRMVKTALADGTDWPGEASGELGGPGISGEKQGESRENVEVCVNNLKPPRAPLKLHRVGSKRKRQKPRA